ncbi:MAG: FAD-binding oxidoreductase [Acidobacteriota bacterium]
MDPCRSWGKPPWESNFVLSRHSLPQQVGVAVVGGGFTGLTAAAWLRRCAPEKTVAVFERHQFGCGGSGRTGGISLAETVAGDLPGLGNVLEGFKSTLVDLGVECDAVWNGVYEIAHGRGVPGSVLRWQDSGLLSVAREVPGGSVDPGRMLVGLAQAAERLGVLLFEESSIEDIYFGQPCRLKLAENEVFAEHVLLATNACALELSGLDRAAQPMLTLALATEPLEDRDLEAIGLAEGKPFYTVDLPYLWGRTLRNNSVVFGCGLVHVENWRGLDPLDIRSGEPACLLAGLEDRVHRLHPVLRDVNITHRWGGPILFPNDGRLFFHTHALGPNAVVLGGYAGQGVTLSVHLGRWAAEALLGRKGLPAWDHAPGKGRARH